MQSDLAKARAALDAGNTDEALVHLWNSVEPARLAGDAGALREVATLAQSIPGREARDLLAATGVELAAAPPEQPSQPPTPKTTGRRFRPGLMWLAAVLLVAIVNVAQHFVPDGARTTRPAERPAGAERVAPGLHLVPLDQFPAEELGDLVPTIAPTAGIVFVRHQVTLDASTYDPVRKQYVAERLLLVLRQQFAFTGAHTLIIGITSLDMYSAREMKKQRVSVARSDDGLVAVISTFGFGSFQEGRQVALGRAILREISRTATEPPV